MIPLFTLLRGVNSGRKTVQFIKDVVNNDRDS